MNPDTVRTARSRAPKFSKRAITLIALVVVPTLAMFHAAVPAGAEDADGGTQIPTVTTDAPDYTPNSVVTITGDNWNAGETVMLNIHAIPTIAADATWTVTADGDGHFTDASFSTNNDHLGATLTLSATGDSGSTASWTFADACGSSPAGTAYAAGDYKSVATGNWNSAATWQKCDGTNFVATATTPTAADGIITISTDTIVTVTAGVSVDQVQFQTSTGSHSSELVVNSGVTLTLNDAAGIDMSMRRNSVLQINGTANFAGSVTLAGANGSSLSQINVAAGASFNLTGTANLSGSFGGLTIDGSMKVSGTTSAAGFSLGDGSTVNVDAGGQLSVGTDPSTTGTIGLGATNSSTFTISGTVTMSGGGDIVTTGGSSGANQTFVNSGGKLTLNTGSIMSSTTGGPIAVNAGGTLEVGEAGGISSTAGTGSIQVAGARTFSNAANYAYIGTAAQVTGNSLPTTVNNFTINNGAGVSLTSASVTVNGTLALTNGDLTGNVTQPTSAPASTGTGDVVGTVTRSGAFTNGTAYTFGNPNNRITYTSGTGPNPTSVKLVKSAPTSPAFASAVKRTYTITASGSFTATGQLHYNDTDLNGNTEAALHLWKNVAGTWTDQNPSGANTTVDTTNNFVKQTGITSFSDWALANAVDLVPPTSTITFPVNGTAYNSGTFTDAITGTAADSGLSGLKKIEVSIKDNTTNLYWNGTAFVSASQVFVSASGTSAWTYSFSDTNLTNNHGYTVTSRATDNANNVETSPPSVSFTYDDFVSVTIPTFTDPVNQGNQTTVTASGATDDNTNTVKVTITDVGAVHTVGPITANVSSGNWSIPATNLSALNDGQVTYTVTVQDTAGNTASAFKNATKDTAIAVAVSTVTDPINATNVAGASASGTTDDNANTVKVTVSDAGNAHTAGPFTASVSSGAWSVTGMDVSTLNDGTITYKATATDAAGNSISSTKTALKDTAIAVTMPTVTDPVNQGNTTSVAASGTTDDDANIVEVTITDVGAAHTVGPFTATVASGAWSISGVDVSSLNDGTITYSVTATDAAGNSVSAFENAVKDTVIAVAVTTVTDPVIQSNQTNTSASGTTDDDANTVKVTISDAGNAHTVGPITATVASGSWSVSGVDVSSLNDGTITYKATATDASGNATDASKNALKDTTIAVTVDLVTDPVNQGNKTVTNASGTTDDNANTVKVTVSDAGNAHTVGPFTATVVGTTWSLNNIDVTALDDGTITYSATATDAPGNTATASLTATKDATIAASTDTVTDPVNQANQAGASASGTTDDDANTVKVTVTDAGNAHSAGPFTASVASGDWSVTGMNVSALNDGTITYTATATDAVGNSTSASKTALKDTTISVAVTAVTDPVNQVNRTNTTASGTTDDGANTVEVSVFDGVNSVGPFTAAVSSGTWSATGIDVSSLNDGTITYKATATDAAGNSASDTKTATKDTVITVDVIAVTDPVNQTNRTSTSASGTTDDDANTVKVTISDAGNAHTVGPMTATVASGSWSVSGVDVSALNDGTITYTATATDAAGNSTTDAMTATKDTVIDVTVDAVTEPVTNANKTSTSASGTTDDDANTVKVTVTDAGNAHSAGPFTATVASGSWSVSGMDVSALNDGTITFTATATDAAGNATTDTKTALKDTTVAVAVDTVTDPVTNANKTNTSASGTTDQDTNVVTVTVSDAGSAHTVGPFTATVASGAWSLSGIDVSTLNDGTITYTANATDVVGNGTSDTKAALKDTFVAVTVDTVTDPIYQANETSTGASGTTDDDTNDVQVTASDAGNAHTVGPFTASVGSGNWSVSGIDVSTLDDGTITYTATATDAVGNTTSNAKTATKDTTIDVAITSVTDPVNNAGVTNVGASGTTDDDANTVNVWVSDAGAVHTVGPFLATVGSGAWSVTGIDVSSLSDGTVTYTAIATDAAGNEDTDTKDAMKDTVIAVAVSTVTDPVNQGNQTVTSASGTTDDNANIVKVTVSDGSIEVGPFNAPVASHAWLVSGIDVSSLSDGTITFKATATDAAGNTTIDSKTASKDTVISVTVDTVTDPVNQGSETATSASGTTDLDTTNAVSVKVSDGVNEVGPFSATVGSGAWSVSGIDVSTLDDGTITYTATATDGAGNSTTDSKTALKDTAIAVSITTVTDAVNQGNQTSAAASGTTDEDTNTVKVTVTDSTLTTAGPFDATVASGAWSVSGMDLSGLADGPITYKATATDAAGNSMSDTESATKDTEISVTVDTVTNPVKQANESGVTADGTTDDDANSVEVTVSDAGNAHTVGPFPASVSAGVWSVSGIDVSTLNDGTITFKATATDAAGNTTDATKTANKDATIAVTIDSVTNPNQSNEANAAASGTTDDDANTVTVKVSDGSTELGPFSAHVTSGNWSVTGMDLSSLADVATITYTVTATDSVGNTATASATATKDATISISVDNVTDPVNQANKTNVGADGTTDDDANSVEVWVSDAGNAHTVGPFAATVASGLWSVSGIDVSSLNDGTITYKATATDGATNSSTSTKTALKDTTIAVALTTVTDPVTSATQLGAAASGTTDANTNTVEVTVTDGSTTVGPFTASVGSGTWSVSGLDVSSLNDGTITYKVTATDGAGNSATNSKTATKDTAAPTGLVLESPADGATVNTTAPILDWSNATDPHGPVTYTVQYVMKGATCDFAGATTVSGLTNSNHQPALANNTYCWRVLALDAFGNATGYTAAWTFTVDSNPPNTVLDSYAPPASPTNVTSANFTFHSTEALGSLTCKLDALAPVTCNSGSISYAGPLAPGSHTFSVYATDAAGNADPSPATRTWVVDLTAPDTVIDTTPPASSASASATFTFHATETPATFECKLDSGAFTASCSSGVSYTGLANGSHTFQVRATDAAGNTDATPATYSWTVSVSTASSCALCVLSPSANGALELTGNSAVTVQGGVVVNSTSTSAAKVGGDGSLTATGTIAGPAAPNGFQKTGNGKYSPAPVNGPGITDPYAAVPLCPAAGAICPSGSATNVSVSGNTSTTINPGVYGKIEITGNGNLTLNPGVYIINTSLKISGNGGIVGNGVTLYFVCSAYPTSCAVGKAGAMFELTGNGKLQLAPPSSSAFAGITIMYDRNNTATSKLSGNGSGFGGAIYMPAGQLELTGNGNTLRSRVIVGVAKLSGNSSLTIQP